MSLALPEALKQVYLYIELTRALEAEEPERLNEWKEKLKVWEANGQKGDDCPYEETRPGTCTIW